MKQQETLPECIARLGLSIRAEFVPFGQSRNAKEKRRSLNWRVTLVKRWINSDNDARFTDILTTDYSAGIGHCPAYKAGVKRFGGSKAYLARAIEIETETGCRASAGMGDHPYKSTAPITPKPDDVIHSLAMDSDALDYSSFEEWAENFGYDPDSRKAESIYQACLKIALAIHGGIGEKAMAELRAAASDY